MIYSVKLRAVGGKSGAQNVTYSTFQIEAPNETEAARLATIKARQRYFGENPTVRIIAVTPNAVAEPGPAPARGKIEVVDGKLRRTPAQGSRA